MKNSKNTSQNAAQNLNRETLESIARRAHYLATQMVFQANHRSDKEKGDPKVGGHVSASASSLHIVGALHLVVRTGFDHVANKPHASPSDHAYNYLLDLFLKSDLSRLSQEECDTAMMGLRKFSHHGEPVFQSYHSAFDPDQHNFFPSGSVGIPPVQAGYLALAYRYAREHGYEVPDAHFWAVCGDAEFREGSMFEATPDFAERELGNLTWILDYNRQSLDGHRIVNESIFGGSDAVRIENTMAANGWEVIQVRHGSKRKALFQKPGGDVFQNFLENELKDYELQALLLVKDVKLLKEGIKKEHPNMKRFLDQVSDEELMEAFRDLGGHDIISMVEAMEKSKQSTRRPTIIIAHTLKGWGLKMAAAPGNHSALLGAEELEELRKKQKISEGKLFERFAPNSEEGKFLKARGEKLYGDIIAQNDLKKKNQAFFAKKFSEFGGFPASLDINTKMTSYPHTQWMLGQLTAKLTRIANTPLDENQLQKGQKPLSENELPWKVPSELFVTMAPDVGTSTNLNPAMDGKIFGAPIVQDVETELGVKDSKLPDLVPSEEVSDRYLRFEITECNVMSCVGSFGRIRDTLGIPLMPLMTIYDFFIKRALDQYFYNMYWKSSFICVGTPSGVTLSPEGAQHGWKSDIQIPNQITWEPFYCQELDWIFCDALKRHFLNDNVGRSGVVIRGVTRGAEQKDMMTYLKKQVRFKNMQAGTPLCRTGFELEGAVNEETVEAISEDEILRTIREEVLAGAYYLIDYRGYTGYEPGENVVHIFSMGSPTTEAIKASEDLLTRGIYANVIVVTSSDLLCGIQGYENDYAHMKHGLQIDSKLYIRTPEEISPEEMITISGKRIPIVSVHDGEAGMLDNLGSIAGVKQVSCAVRKHSKVGRPADVYAYHGIDWKSLVEAAGKALAETAMDQTTIPGNTALEARQLSPQVQNWTELWPTSSTTKH